MYTYNIYKFGKGVVLQIPIHIKLGNIVQLILLFSVKRFVEYEMEQIWVHKVHYINFSTEIIFIFI